MEIAALFAAVAPLAFLAAGLAALRAPGPRPALAACVLAAAAALLTAGAAVLWLILAGPATGRLPGPLGAVLALRIDALSVTLLTLIGFVGAVVLGFSRNYLAGDPRHARFLGGLGLTLAAVALLVLSGSVLLLAAAWIATSLALHRLLVFYPERPAAVVAARKKFLAARLGDACLLAAAGLLIAAFGTAEIARMLEAARAGTVPADTPAVTVAALLIALAALLKSAQLPTHGWLLEVMETPTPVSALLHAGIINAGGFLVVRFADVMLLAPAALHLLAVVGGATALVAGAVMLTQTSVKVSLAWSTVAQMGFMLLQCGLGVFAAAALHLVAHSLYKAHAFLAAGSAVEAARLARPGRAGSAPRRPALLAGLAAGLALYAAGALLAARWLEVPAAVLVLGAILVLGVSHLLARAAAAAPGPGVPARALAAAATVAGAYVVLHAAAAGLLQPTLPPVPAPGPMGTAIMAALLAAFAGVSALQLAGPPAAGSAWRGRAYVHLANGLYANAWFNRLVGAYRRTGGGTA